MNPFLVAGCDSPKTPLDPGFRGTMDDYADVDRTEESFGQFTASFGDGRRVLDSGRFIVVNGDTGSGKTALINRCVRWLDSADGPGLHQHIVDVRLDLDPSDSIADRQSHVSARVVDELSGAGVFHPDSPLLGHPGEAKRVYPALGRELGPNTFVTVLLPPSADLTEELRFYARFTRSKMLVFAEMAFVDKLSDRRGEFEGSPLFLEVGPLREPDGDVYADKRLAAANGWPLPGSPPPIEAGELAALLRLRPVSIGEIQQTLHDVYEDFIQSGSAPPVVTKDHFLHYFFRRVGRTRSEG